MRATNLLHIILLLGLVVPYGRWPEQGRVRPPWCEAVSWRVLPAAELQATPMVEVMQVGWHETLVPPGRTRQRHNPARNRQRWQRRYQRWLRTRPPVSRRQRRRRQQAVLRAVLGWTPPVRPAATKPSSTQPAPSAPPAKLPAPTPAPEPVAPPTPQAVSQPVLWACPAQDRPRSTPAASPSDPLAELRQSRGWIDGWSEEELWELLRRVRWAGGLCCPHCGETAPTCLEVIDRHYRGGLYRYRCLICHLAGDEGEGGTFTDLTGTLFDGCRLDIRSLWLIVELFVEQAASVATSDEVQVNRHTVDRYFRLLRGAIYLTRSDEPIALGPEHIVEGDEVYLTAGLKGAAGDQTLTREPRQRGLKRRGRGTWDSDRVPILGLLCRGGQVRLFTLRNVQTTTIRPVIEQMVQQGARVYTDSYDIYHFLGRAGYQHATVHHGAGEYARGEVHCNTIECTWSWLRQAIRTYRGVSKVYLPLYVAQFEFFFNRRHTSRWSQMLDVLQVAFQADAQTLLNRVDGAEFAEVCPVAG